jgi:hypothetical protein
MSGQVPRLMGSIALVATLLMWSVGVGAPIITARADDCLAEPNSPAPAGSHWYYHMDRATQRKCWYIRATDQPAQPAAAQATSDPASDPASPPPATIPAEKPATASVGGPVSISPDGGTAPSPGIKERVKPQRASVSGAATGQSAQQGAQKATPQASPSLSIQAPVPQARPSSQTNDQGATARSVPAPVWPEPPVATFKTQEPTAPPSHTRTEFTKPTADTADTPVSDGAKSTAEGGASATNTAGITTSASMMPVEMFLIVALGLVVAGILLRVVTKISVMKIFAARRPGITIDRHDFDRIDDLAHELDQDQIIHRDALSEYLHLQRSKIPAASDPKPRRPPRVGNDRPDITRAGDSVSHITNKISMREQRRIDVDPGESEWSDEQHQHESDSINPPGPDSIDDRHQDEGCNDQRQHGSVSEADELLHDLQSSLIATASEYRPRPSPLQADDRSSNDARGKDGPSQISHEIREGEEVLERLRRDLDQLLQSPKVA